MPLHYKQNKNEYGSADVKDLFFGLHPTPDCRLVEKQKLYKDVKQERILKILVERGMKG